MVPNKLVYSGIFFLEHERVYTRLLGRPEYPIVAHWFRKGTKWKTFLFFNIFF